LALGDARAALGIRRRVRLLRTPAQSGVGTPLTWGTLRPTVLVPAEAASWPPEHRRAVLLHELAHVRRLDCLLALLGDAACALWWCHPGVWWAAHRLRLERERACDARVLRAGVRASDYAECLLRIADASHGERPLGPAVVAAHLLPARTGAGVAAAFVRRSHLHARLRDILTPRTAPWQTPGRLAPAATAFAGLALVATAGTVRLAPRPAVLWAALRSPAWTTRATAAEGIARFGDAGSVARLHATLGREPDPRVRAMARFGAGMRRRGHGTSSPGARPPFGWPQPHDLPAHAAR
jgi:hypothetical protein